MFLSLCLRLGKVAAVAAFFLCPACCLEKEMVHHFQSLLMMCIKGMWVGVLSNCLLGKEDAFLCMAYTSPWHLGKWWQTADTLVATAGWGLPIHSTTKSFCAESFQFCQGRCHKRWFYTWNCLLLEYLESLQTPTGLRQGLSGAGHRSGAYRVKHPEKKGFMWLYVSFNFLVENAVNLSCSPSHCVKQDIIPIAILTHFYWGAFIFGARWWLEHCIKLAAVCQGRYK